MYNGIGLVTPRGSGTNGHVQRNWALVRKTKDRVNYKTEEEIAQLDSASNRQPNKDILDHERKRKIEVKCAELEDVLEQQGFSSSEVEDKIAEYRAKLVDGDSLDKPAKDAFGRVIVRETHQLAEAQQEKNARLREAFGISSHFVEGSSLKGGSRAGPGGRAEAPYLPVRTPSPDLEPEPKKKKRHASSSPEVRKEKKRKSKKNKKDKSSSKKEKKKKRSRSSESSSSSEQDSDSDSGASEKNRRKRKQKKHETKQKQGSERDDSSCDSSPEKVSKKRSKKQHSEEREHVSSKGKKGDKEVVDIRGRDKNRKSSPDVETNQKARGDESVSKSFRKYDKYDQPIEKIYISGSKDDRKKSNSQRSRSKERNEIRTLNLTKRSRSKDRMHRSSRSPKRINKDVDSPDKSELARRSRSKDRTNRRSRSSKRTTKDVASPDKTDYSKDRLNRRSRTPKRIPKDTSPDKVDYTKRSRSKDRSHRKNSRSPKRAARDANSPDKSKMSKYSNYNRQDLDSSRRRRDEASRSPVQSRYNRSASPKHDRDISRKSRRDDSRSPVRRRHSPPAKRDRSSPSPSYKRRERHRSPWHNRDRDNRSPKLSRRDRNSRSPRPSKKETDNRTSRRSPDKKNHSPSPKHSRSQKNKSPKRSRSRTPKDRRCDRSSDNQDRSPVCKTKANNSDSASYYKKSTVDHSSRTPDNSPPRKNEKQPNIIESKSDSVSNGNAEVITAELVSKEFVPNTNQPDPNLSPKLSVNTMLNVSDNVTHKAVTTVKELLEVLNVKTLNPVECISLPELPADVKLDNIIDTNNSVSSLKKPTDTSPIDDTAQEKRSPSAGSKSSSSLSYSPARRSPERYIDVINKLSDKDKSKYIQSEKKKSKNDSKEPSGSDSSKKFKQLKTPQPVVRLRASFSEDSGDDHDVSRLDDDEDQHDKELDLLKIGLAIIAKESVKKRMEQKARDEGIPHALPPVDKPGPSAAPPTTGASTAFERNGSASSESMDISPEHKEGPKSEILVGSQEEVNREKEKVSVEVKRRRLQTPDKSRSTSHSRSRSRSSSSSSSASSRRSKRKYSSGSSSASSSSARSSSRYSRSSRSSRSRSGSASSRSVSGSRSRSPSIPRRAGSPSFLDRRRITSARKRPIPYRRPTPSSQSSSSEWSSRSPSPTSRNNSPPRSHSPLHVSPKASPSSLPQPSPRSPNNLHILPPSPTLPKVPLNHQDIINQPVATVASPYQLLQKLD